MMFKLRYSNGAGEVIFSDREIWSFNPSIPLESDLAVLHEAPGLELKMAEESVPGHMTRLSRAQPAELFFVDTLEASGRLRVFRLATMEEKGI